MRLKMAVFAPIPSAKHSHRRRRERPRLHELSKRKPKVVKHIRMMPRGGELDSTNAVRVERLGDERPSLWGCANRLFC